LGAEELDKLDKLYHRFTPSDPVAKYAWLFSERPELPSPSIGYEESGQQVDRLRQRAVEALVKTGGRGLIRTFVNVVRYPLEVGIALGKSDYSNRGIAAFLKAELEASDPAREAFAKGFIFGRQIKSEGRWTEMTLLPKVADSWSADAVASVLECLPFTKSTWELARKRGPEVERSYWRGSTRYFTKDVDDGIYAARQFLDFDRPIRAIDLLGFIRGENLERIPSSLIADALEKAIRSDETDPEGFDSFGYHVGELLQVIATRGDLDETRLAMLEFVYLPITSRSHTGRPALLLKKLTTEPDFFVEVAELLQGKGRTTTEPASADAEVVEGRARELLDLIRSIPGLREDGTVDARLLKRWVLEVRKKCNERDVKRCDWLIGKVLRWSPADNQNVWPATEVRDLIEDLASDELENAIRVEIYNTRGVTSRGQVDGGEQERAIAQKYAAWASVVSSRWPRTGALLQDVADSYRRDASREDVDAELTQDLWR
jgi:hypothetical protein